MKRIITLAVSLLVFITTMADVVKVTYNVENAKVSTVNGYNTISFDKMMLTGKTGEPALPWNAIKVMLPPGHEAVSISFTGNDMITLNGYYKVYPMQPSRPLSISGSSDFKINNEVYSSASKIPAIATGTLSTHFMNGYSYALCTFSPVEYYPATGVINYYSSVTITIETQPTQRAANALLNISSDPKTTKKCLAYAENPEMGTKYSTRSRSGNDYDILIITAQSFVSQIQSLVTLYNDQALKSKIYTVQEIQTMVSGLDSPEKVRNFIIGEYQNNGINQVILGGDVEHVPYRGFYCAAQSSTLYEDNDIPSDLYFSALDGNWNANGNYKWGEPGEDDLLPEISVGRMPFSNATELAAMLNKTTRYQTQPITGELNNHLFAGENLWYNPDTWGSDYLELLIGYRDDNGYSTTGMPANYPITRLYDEINQWSPQTLINTINSGRSFINHVGHANENYTMKLYNWDITNSNFSGVNGILHNYPIIYTHGCICGAFDANDCIGERMVAIENFAAAFVGNSRYGWFNEGQTEGPSAHLNREFIDALFTDSLHRIGSAHMESKIATAPWVNAPGQWEEGALRWCFYDCNVLGDPAMSVWTNEPIQITTTYPEAILIGGYSTQVTVTSNGLPAKDLNVALIKNNVLIGKGITDATGHATVILDSAITQSGSAKFVVSGYNCKPTIYNTTFTTSIGINEISYSDISIYPNPTPGVLMVELPHSGFTGKVIITDLAGKVLIQRNVQPAEKEIKLHLADLKSGVYMLKYYQNGETLSYKIIRN